MDIILAFLGTLVAQDLAHAAMVALIVGPFVVRLVNMADAEFKLDAKKIFKLDAKFVLSIGLSFVVPTGAYTALQLASGAPITADGYVVAAAVGWMVAQTFHQATKPDK